MYVSKVLEHFLILCHQSLPTATFQRDNARPHVTRIAQDFFFFHQIALLFLPPCSPDLSPIKNVYSMIAERLARDTPPVATPDQLWQYTQEH